MRAITPPFIGSAEESTPVTSFLVYDYTALAESNLLVHRKAPVGPVEIDTSQKINQRLAFSSFFNTERPRDLVTGKLLTKSGSPSVKTNARVNRALDFDKATPDYYTFNGLANWSGNRVVIEYIGAIDSFDSSGTMLVSWTDNGTYYTQLGSTMNCYIWQASVGYIAPQIDDGLIHHVFTTQHSTGLRQIFIDGVDRSNLGQANVSIPAGSKTAHFMKYAGGTDWDWDGNVELIRLWDSLSLAEILALTDDPYSIYKAVG